MPPKALSSQSDISDHSNNSNDLQRSKRLRKSYREKGKENLDAALENNLNSNAHIEHHQQSRSPSVELQSRQICNENQQDQNKASQIHDSSNHNNSIRSSAYSPFDSSIDYTFSDDLNHNRFETSHYDNRQSKQELSNSLDNDDQQFEPNDDQQSYHENIDQDHSDQDHIDQNHIDQDQYHSDQYYSDQDHID
ncbi:16599_t:CDS:2 [Cetraspora pellucida]|uniref:16599_t:CDS:1 n=1 Tax=Cetraspora pellucida TaxID=1433469 RepID=A0ACA9KRJ7_9GLOM|nr:16599_t:CDS:2 [Cetraspora pellucida]